MTTRTATHATFVIERSFKAPPARVFAAFSDEAQKGTWFVGPPEWVLTDREFDFSEGGREAHRVGPPGGDVHSFDARYIDIVPDERIVFSYQMHINQRRISVSLTTIELAPDGAGTKLTFTEQGVFLDGYDDVGRREEGTALLLNQLDAFVHGTEAGSRA